MLFRLEAGNVDEWLERKGVVLCCWLVPRFRSLTSQK